VQIATWNVLHRIHAVNWHEAAIDVHVDERARITAIASRVATLADVVCLQEVSGDQLALLRALPGVELAVHTYPRVPRLFRPGPMPLTDPTEHLVVVSKRPLRAQRGHTFAGDRGKGYLAVELDDLTVIDTHVSYGDHHGPQCADLAEAAGGHARVAIVGDFNADRAACLGALAGFAAAEPVQPALPTRPRTKPGGKSQDIDHVFVRGVQARDVAVLSGDGLSDHNPVVATI
jgi:endonuclease/exonuclease/phosphatase family metal-dependent hydrolase